jgi:Na+/proline symporter
MVHIPSEAPLILTPLDWLVIAAYFAVNLAIGFFYMRRASGDIGEFFLSGRNVSWWLAGTSMVATTFGADTPLVVTGLIYAQGIAGNWLWWSFLLSGMLTVFFFAPLSQTWSSPNSATRAHPQLSFAASVPSISHSPSTPSSWAG